MIRTTYNKKARFVYGGQYFDAFQFCALETQLSWLIAAQEVVKFWLDDTEHLELQTSGSTGHPKKITLPKNVLQQSALATLAAFNLEEENNAFLFLPCSFIGGKMMVIRTLVGGLHLHLAEPKLALPQLQRDFDFVALTPMQASNSLLQLNCFKRVLLGGGPVHAGLMQKLQSIEADVYHSYGMTETASHIALRKLNGADSNEDFVALKGVSFRVDNRNCLQIDAPLWDAKKLQTNDVVELKNARVFVWKGRTDNVINSGGVKIYPEEIEKVLEQQIDAAFFIGAMPDAKSGEKLVLFIEGAASYQLDFNALSKLQRPKQVIFLPQFEYTETNKINREKTVQAFLQASEKG